MDYIEKLNLQTEEVEEVENLEKHKIIISEPFSVNKYKGHTDEFLALDGEYDDGFKQLKETIGLGINCIVSKRVNELRTSLDNIESQINNIAEFNVKNYGAKGDGVTDDTNAIISAINDFTLKGGNKLTFPSGVYKITEPLLIDLKENRNMSIEMNGYILPIDGIGRAITLINGVNVNATIRVKGGGLYKYHKGFSNEVTGLDCALYIRAISGLVLNMFTDDFRGRGLEVERKQETDNIKTDMFNFGKLIFRNVGQAMYVNIDTGVGCFGDIWALETDGSYFTGADISINSYENTKIGEPVLFENCVSLHLGRILLGENENLIQLENCHNVTVQHLYLFGYNQVNLGCILVNCRQMDINIKSSGCTTAVMVNGLVETNININSKNDKTICYVSTSSYAVENVNFNIIGKDTQFTGFETSKGEWLFDSVTLTGSLNKVVIDSKDVCLDVVNSYIREFVIPAENNVRVINNRFGSFNNDPKLKQFCE